MRNLAFGAIGVAILLVVAALVMREDGGAPADDGAGTEAGQLLQANGRGVLLNPTRDGGAAAGTLLSTRERVDETTANDAPSAPAEPTVTDEAAPRFDPSEWDPAQGHQLDREITVAANLFHLGPARFHAWMTQADRGLSPVRTRLALAFAVALAGGTADLGTLRDELAEEPEVAPAELGLLDMALGQRGARAIPAASRNARPLEIGMELTIRRARAEGALEARAYRSAAELASSLLLPEIGAPWDADSTTLGELAELLHEAQEHHRWSRKSDWPHRTIVVEPGDSLIAIRKRFLADPRNEGLHICTGLIDRANGIDGRYLRAGQELKVPTEPVNVLVDLSARWVFYRIGAEVVAAWEVGVGAPETRTDVGEYTVGEKTEEPTWFRPGHPEIPFGHPEHAIGTRWIGWNDDFGHTSLGFHGTNEPETVGGAVSNGCVRLRNEEVEKLFEILPRGARVTVQH